MDRKRSSRRRTALEAVFYYHLGRRIRRSWPGSAEPGTPMLDLAWEYPTEGPHRAGRGRVLREIGWVAPTARPAGYLS